MAIIMAMETAATDAVDATAKKLNEECIFSVKHRKCSAQSRYYNVGGQNAYSALLRYRKEKTNYG